MQLYGANTATVAGLYVGAAVLFWLEADDKARVGLIVRLRDMATDVVDADPKGPVWNGTFPRVDVLTISPLGAHDGEPVLVSALPHAVDVSFELSLQGVPPKFIESCPRYVLVESLRGRE
jgi:hypothetical protein